MIDTNRPKFSDSVMKHANDGDFQTVMASVNFSTTPMEVITIRDMQDHYSKQEFKQLIYINRLKNG